MLSRLSRQRPSSRTAASSRLPDSLPNPVDLELDEPTLFRILRARGSQSLSDSYAGVPLMKLPEDLRAYEHMMWLSTTQVVVELGTWAGGSALWFRDRLRTLAAYGHISRPHVISVDIDISTAKRFLTVADPKFADTITLIEGDVCDSSIAEQIKSLIQPNSSVMVVDDSAHTYESTSAVLGAYADLIQPGGFFVVEDVGVDIEGLRQDPNWPRGVLRALQEWLKSPSGQRFTVRRDLELYGITNILQGFLQRTR